MQRTLIILGLLAAPALGHAESFITAAQLAKACAPNSREAASCDAFIAGALDEVETAPELKSRLCLPPGTKLGVLRQSVATFAQEKPDAVKGSAVALLNAMVTSHFPCKS